MYTSENTHFILLKAVNNKLPLFFAIKAKQKKKKFFLVKKLNKFASHCHCHYFYCRFYSKAIFSNLLEPVKHQYFLLHSCIFIIFVLSFDFLNQIFMIRYSRLLQFLQAIVRINKSVWMCECYIDTNFHLEFISFKLTTH